MSDATLLLKTRARHRQGLVEMVVWRLPQPLPPSEHGFKYRLVYVVDGVRVVGYDNERGKGDHRHIAGAELPYAFSDVPTLVADFMADVESAA